MFPAKSFVPTGQELDLKLSLCNSWSSPPGLARVLKVPLADQPTALGFFLAAFPRLAHCPIARLRGLLTVPVALEGLLAHSSAAGSEGTAAGL